MKFISNLLLLSEVFPYFTRGSNIKNKFQIIRSIMFGNSRIVKFTNGINYTIPISLHSLFVNLLQIERYSQIFDLKDSKIEVSFDTQNKFYLSLKLDEEDKRLLALLAYGIVDGAVFLDMEHNTKIINDKVIKIIQGNRSTIETSEGIKFFLDSIGPDSIVETYVRRIHDNYSYDLQNKIVIDAGASIGDTPLYFASKGATVYAFELTKRNYDQMLDNLQLNSSLSKQIIPVNAGVGKDGIIEYNENISKENYDGAASFVVNKYGQNSVKRKVKGMTVKTIIETYSISDVYLLKLDCKGCEYYLKKEELHNIHRLKIEYYSYLKNHKLSDLVKLLKESNFDILIFKHNPNDMGQLGNRGNIVAEKII